MKERGHLLVPIVVIVYLLLIGRTPLYAAFYGIISSIAVSFLTRATRLTWKSFFKAMESGARQSVGVGIACAVVGNIIGITNLTGLGLVLGDNIVSLAGGSVLITTFLTMIVCVILGMGLPTTACYIVTATIAAPALMKLGVNPLAAHMFTYYFACLSNLTPPVAIASYAGGPRGFRGRVPPPWDGLVSEFRWPVFLSPSRSSSILNFCWWGAIMFPSPSRLSRVSSGLSRSLRRCRISCMSG